MESNNTTPKEILQNIISVMEKTRVDDWEIDKLVVVLNYINELQEDIANYVKITLHDRKVIDNKQQRIDKAIEYIKELCMFIDKDGKECYLHYGDDLSPNTLINILKGEDNESKKSN